MPIQASIDLTTILQLLQNVLSLIGLVALARIVIEFVSAYTTKQKELSAIDTEIRASLSDAWKNEKELRKQDAEIFSGNLASLRQTAESLQMRLADTSYEIASLKVRRDVGNFVTELVSRLGEEYCKEFFPGAFDTFKDTVKLLALEGKMDIKSFDESMNRGISNGSLPEKANERLVYYSARQFARVFSLARSLIIASAFAHNALEDYDSNKNPDRLVSDIFDSTYKRLSSNNTTIANMDATLSTSTVKPPGGAQGND